MTQTPFNARLGLSVGTTPTNVIDANGAITLPASQGLAIGDGAPSTTTNKLYQIGSSLYFNGSQVSGSGGLTLSSPLTGFTLGTDGTALAATDTILQGYQKLQVQSNNKVDLTSTQSAISGAKTFTNTLGVTVSNSSTTNGLVLNYTNTSTSTGYGIQHIYHETASSPASQTAFQNYMYLASTSTASYVGFSNYISSPAAASSVVGQLTGIKTSLTSGNTTANAYGIKNEAINSSTGTVTSQYGIYTTTENTSTGTIGTRYGVYIDRSNSGTITTGYGLYVASDGTVTNNYAIYVASQTSGYALYGAGTGKLYIGDTTASTSTTTGSGIFYGGLGVAGNLFIGGKLNLALISASTVNGDIWSDSTRESITTFISGIQQSLTGCIFTQTTDKTIATTTGTDLDITGTGVGTKTLPANFFVVGKYLRIQIQGVYTSTSTASNITCKLKFGSTTIASTVACAGGTSKTNQNFTVELTIGCKSIGTSGTVTASGAFKWAPGDTTNNEIRIACTTTTVNTTVSQAISVTLQNSANGFITTSKNMYIEVLN